MKHANGSLMVAVLAGACLASCGGGGSSAPSAPLPAASPSPVAAATPTPAPDPSPTATPCPTDPCELPVERETKPVRLTLRLFVVEDPAGGVYQYQETDDGTPIIPIPYRFRLDVIAKDAKNRETRGSGNVLWHWDDENMIDVENLANPYHPTLRATKGGHFCATAELDDVQSNTLCLEFRY